MNTKEKINQPGNTKERLIEVALELFALNGYEGVSTRQIVDKAEVNISAITYYFGGKEGLYNAVIDSKINLFEEKMNSVLNEISTRNLTDKKSQKTLLLKLIEKYINFLLSSGVSQYLVLLLVREMNSPTTTFELFYNKVIGRIHRAFTRLVASVFNKPEDDEDIILLVSSIIGQILIFRFGKRVILRRLGYDDYNQELLEKIKQLILKQIKITFDNWRY